MASLTRRAPSAVALAVAAAVALTGCGPGTVWSVQTPEASPRADGTAATSGPSTSGVTAEPVWPTPEPGEASAGDEPTVSELSGLVPLDDTEVADLAARMSDVLVEGDEDDWAALFEGEELVEQQRRWFRAVQAVPMDVREVVADAVVERDGPEGTVVQLVLAHQITGADAVPGLQGYRATVRRPPGEEPRISGLGGTDGADAHPQLWDLDAVDVTVTEQLVVLAPDGREGDVAAVLPGLQNAVANAFVDFGEDEAELERLVVQLVDAPTLVEIADDEELAVDPAGVAMAVRGLGARPDPGELGVALADAHVDRIVLDLDRLVDELAHGTPPGGWGVMRHEAVHALVDGGPEVRPPVWVREGLAEWYGYRRDYRVDDAYRQVVTVAGGEELRLPESLEDYYYDSQEAGELAYASSAMVFSFLEQRLGFARTRDVGVGLTGVDTWRDDAEADALLLELTGMTLAELEHEWSAWAVATYG